MLLGCIADDITGATDLALTLKRSGMRTIQVMGVPADPTRLEEFDAVVVALKSRTNAPVEAIAWSLESLDVLQKAGARQIFFKYCSTFDSTDQGNIGPVAEALIEKLGGEVTVLTIGHLESLVAGGWGADVSEARSQPLTIMRAL